MMSITQMDYNIFDCYINFFNLHNEDLGLTMSFEISNNDEEIPDDEKTNDSDYEYRDSVKFMMQLAEKIADFL